MHDRLNDCRGDRSVNGWAVGGGGGSQTLKGSVRDVLIPGPEEQS